MTVLEHLEDLRIRLLKILVSIAVMTAVSFYYSGALVNFLAAPVGGREELVSIDVTENIGVFMRVSLLGGISLGFPFLLYQVVAFISPGLEKRERARTTNPGVLGRCIHFLSHLRAFSAQNDEEIFGAPKALKKRRPRRGVFERDESDEEDDGHGLGQFRNAFQEGPSWRSRQQCSSSSWMGEVSGWMVTWRMP